jgi:uncharacterized protein
LQHAAFPATSAVMFSRTLSLLLLPLALTCCKTAPASHEGALASALNPAKPALWKLSDADTTIYLFGTIHLLPKDFNWITPAIDKATKDSSELVLEVGDLDDQQKTAQTFMSLALSPNLPPLADRVPKAEQANLKILADKSGAPAVLLDRLETWAAAITLSAGMMKDLKLSTEQGAERILSQRFKDAKRPISGLETTEQQLGYFDALPEKSQRVFLTSLIEEQADVDTEFGKMISAWSRGDDKAIAISFDDEVRISPELSDVLIRKRNANWTAWLTERMKTPGTIFVAVGAGHLAGKDSVQSMLAKKGLKTVRVQ